MDISEGAKAEAPSKTIITEKRRCRICGIRPAKHQEGHRQACSTCLSRIYRYEGETRTKLEAFLHDNLVRSACIMVAIYGWPEDKGS